MVIDKFALSQAIETLKKNSLNHLTEFLEKNIPVFNGLSRHALEKLCGFLHHTSICHNQIVFRHGQKVEKLYIVYEGEFEQSKPLESNFKNDTVQIFGLIN